MVQFTGEGLIYEVTASGGYEDCIGMLADELADLDEPFVRLVIRMKRGGGASGLVGAHTCRAVNWCHTSYHPRHERAVCGVCGARFRYKSARADRAATLMPSGGQKAFGAGRVRVEHATCGRLRLAFS
jgi:hypothetical protein